MATRGFVRTQVSGRVHRFVWLGLGNGDDGEPISIPGAADMTFQAFGTFGAGGTIIMEGTCRETAATFFQMRDGGDNVISFDSADGEMLAQMVAFIRPRVTAGDVTTDLTAILLARSTMK